MKALLSLTLALALAGCPGRTSTPRAPTIEEVRARAAAHPNDPDAQRALAVAELLGPGGDPARARPAVEHALQLAPGDDGLHLVAALDAHTHGRIADALEGFIRALEVAAESDRETAPYVAEVAATALEEMIEMAPRFAETARERLERVARRPGHIGAPARHALGEVLLELAQRRGDMEAVRAIARDHGCIPEWRVAGPFGPWELLGFDERHPPLANGPMAESYDLGPGRGVRATRTLEASGCSVHLGDGPLALGGTTYAEATVEVPDGGDYVFRVETPNSVELYVDGQRAVRRDMRRAAVPRIGFHEVELPAGRHELTVKVSTRHPNPVLVVALVDGRGRSLADGEADEEAPPSLPEGTGDSLDLFLRAVLASARGEPVAAREAMRSALRARNASGALLMQASIAALADPTLASDTRRDEARRYLRRAAQRSPGAWFPILQLAQLEAAEGQDLAAIERLEQAAARFPEVVFFPLALGELHMNRGWDAEGAVWVARALEAAPGTCASIGSALRVAESRDRTAEVERLLGQLISCDARRSERFSHLMRQRRWDDAARELERLAALQTRQSRYRILSAQLELTSSRGDDAALDRTLQELVRFLPRSPDVRLAQADRHLAEGRTEDAQRLLDQALTDEPADMAMLHRIRRLIGGRDDLAPHRLDGAEIIRSFESSGRTYDGPQVLVLDYTVTRVYEDGSVMELTHNIFRVQSEEAVDELGEFSPPEGAQILTLHTIKADGRRLEPDEIEGKDTISLPRLAPGDYVEFEYVRLLDAPSGFPGGAIGDRFYFQSFEVPFDRSELTVVMPARFEPIVSPRGPAPRTEERVEGDVRILHFRVNESRPLVREPASVAPTEYLPSVLWGVRAGWESYVNGLRDVLIDKDLADPAARRIALAALGEHVNGDPLQKARLLYDWVLENIEDDGDLAGLAPAMLAARTGSRARILHYMLGLVGVPSRLVMARDTAEDQTESELAEDDPYKHLLVMVTSEEDGRTENIFLATQEQGAPFGYLPASVRGQIARVLADGAPVIQLPAAREGEDRRTIEVEAFLSADGSARFEVVETFRGSGAVSWRNDLEGVPEAELEERFDQAYVSRLVPGASLTSLRIDGRRTAERPLVLTYVFRVPALGRRQGADWILPALYPSSLAPGYAPVGARTTTQIILPPVDADVTLLLHLPQGTPPPADFRPVTLEGPNGATYRTEAGRGEEGFRVSRTIRIPVMRVTPEQYPAFATFCRRADEAEARELRLRLR